MRSAFVAGVSFMLGRAGVRWSADTRPNILLIVSDALRRDFVGKIVRGTTVMPNIERLALSGTAFTTCIAPSSWTLFSVPGILSSKAPLPSTAAIGPRTAYFPQSAVNCAEVLSGEWMTTAVIKNPWLYEDPHLAGAERRLFSRGFESYHTPMPVVVDTPLFEVFGGPRKEYAYEDARKTTDQALNVLKRRKYESDHRPFFIYLHYMDTHEPYYPPEEYRGKFASDTPISGVRDSHLMGTLRAFSRQRGEKRLLESEMPILERAAQMYTAAANYVDDQLGRIFEFLRESREFDRTIIVFTSDHGEEFAEHGWLAHTDTLYREVLEVPLVMAGPGIAKGAMIDGTVASVDIAPALLRMAGLSKRELPFEGEAAAILEGAGARDILSTTKAPSYKPRPDYVATSVTDRTGRKYVRTSHLDGEGNISSVRHELYDLRADPGEKHNIADPNVAYCAACSAGIDAAAAKRAGTGGMRAEIPEGMEEALKSLGYLQ